jgi:hypothetical protein
VAHISLDNNMPKKKEKSKNKQEKQSKNDQLAAVSEQSDTQQIAPKKRRPISF